jgi:hypothetical protein
MEPLPLRLQGADDLIPLVGVPIPPMQASEHPQKTIGIV